MAWWRCCLLKTGESKIICRTTKIVIERNVIVLPRRIDAIGWGSVGIIDGVRNIFMKIGVFGGCGAGRVGVC